MASFDIPTYREWFLDADYGPAYEAHRRTLQHLQWHNPGRWVLKYPKHLLSLGALLDTYPDATFIWTHRDPAVVIPSAVSLTGYMRESNTPDFDPVRFGREWAVIEELALHRGLATRDGGRYPPDRRNIDVHYATLMAHPVETVARICEEAGAEFTDRSRRAAEAVARTTSPGCAREPSLHRQRLRARPRAPALPLRFLHRAVRYRGGGRPRSAGAIVISGERILVTGVTGTIGRALAVHLAEHNEVWGLARFGDAAVRAAETYHAVATPPPTRPMSTREELEAAGVTVRRVDLASGIFDDLPRNFTYVLHLAWLRADIAHLEDALRANVEGAGLLLQHCRTAKAALVMSGMGVYTGNDDPW